MQVEKKKQTFLSAPPLLASIQFAGAVAALLVITLSLCIFGFALPCSTCGLSFTV